VASSPIETKYQQVVGRLRAYRGVLVAFSGGVDSSLLLAAAREALGDAVLAVTARSALQPAREVGEAREVAAFLGARHRVLDTDPLANAELRANLPNRCYLCKRDLLAGLHRIAREEGLEAVVEGSNRDDLEDFRPGARAVRELEVRSPLAEAGLTKPEIYALARARGLPSRDRPPLACLASRVAYGLPLTAERLARIDAAEETLRALGLTQLRVRDHDTVARIEVPAAELARLVRPDVRAGLVERLKALGYSYVALDLEGYRSGAMNEALGPASPGGDLGGREVGDGGGPAR
jgi:uncharacterized protein